MPYNSVVSPLLCGISLLWHSIAQELALADLERKKMEILFQLALQDEIKSKFSDFIQQALI